MDMLKLSTWVIKNLYPILDFYRRTGKINISDPTKFAADHKRINNIGLLVLTYINTAKFMLCIIKAIQRSLKVVVVVGHLPLDNQ